MGPTFTLSTLRLRREWRSLVPTVLLVAAVSGIVLWTSAAARRTDTAFDRMLVATDAFHVLVNPDSGSQTQLTTEDLLGIDGVADASRSEMLVIAPPEDATLESLEEAPGTVFASDGGTGWRLARPIMVRGRFPDSTAPQELFVDVELAEATGLDVGDRYPVRVVTAAGADRMFELEELAYSGTVTEREADAEIAEFFADSAFAPVVDFEVTGIGRLPEMVVVDSGFELPAAIATPALFEQLGSPKIFFGGWHVRLDDPSSIDEFRDAVEALVPDESIVFQTMENAQVKAERATSTPGGIMAVFAVTILALGVVLVWQSVQRWIALAGPTRAVLRAIGADRRVLAGSDIVEIALASTIGFALGAGAAVLASPLAPVGPARLVETEPGLDVDALVLVTGLGVLACVILGTAVVAWRSSNALVDTSHEANRGVVLRLVESAWLPLPASTGIRFALDPVPGRRGSSRLAVVGALTGIVVAVAALVFTASIEHVTSTPRLYGTSWSATMSFVGGEPEPDDAVELIGHALAAVAAEPGVRHASVLLAGEVDINGVRVPAAAFRDSESPIEQTVAEGRTPRSVDEIALGRNTMGQLGVTVGDDVTIRTHLGEHSATVVGQMVLPAVGTYSGADKTAMGDGAVIDASLLDPLGAFSSIALDLEPGTDLNALETRLDQQFPLYGPIVVPYGEPAEVDSLRALAAFPRWLAVALVVLVGIPVVHSLLTSVRGRRHDLAVMSALGAQPRTLRTIGLFQGLTVVAVGTLVGVPLGVVLGRLSWSGLAESFGTIPEPVVPIAAVSLLAVAVLVVGALVGGIPTWRTNRRAVLRSLRPE